MAGNEIKRVFQYVFEKVIPYNGKNRLFIKMGIQLLGHPRQLAYYLKPQKIIRAVYYFRHGGIKQVSRILDERLLMGANLKLEIKLEPMSHFKNINSFPVLNFQISHEPVVSIIIPAYNQFEYTYYCLSSILKYSEGVPYEIILADDCSIDFTTRIEGVARNILVVRPPENSRFLKNCNHAARRARGKYLLFLNNDTQVQEHWLTSLVELMGNHPDIGMAGSKLVYPDGRLQEAGGIVWKDGSAWNYGNGNNPALPEYCYVKDVDYISGASIIIRKELWEETGGFDERYIPSYCEDSDLAFEIRKRGFRVVLQPKSVVVHFEGMSNGTDLGQGLKAYQVTNQAKFFDKWKGILEKEHFTNGQSVFLASDRSRDKRRMLVIDHMVPRYDKDAGAKNVLMYTKMFLEMGIKVTFLPADFFPYQPYTSELEQLGIEVLYGNYYFKYWKEWLEENLQYFGYIYVNRPHIASRFMPILKEYCTGTIIYFGHDLHYLREQREYEISGNPELLESSRTWKLKEFGLIQMADVVYVVGTYEEQLLKKEFPGKAIRNIPIFIYHTLDEDKKICIEGRRDLMFVGGFNHPPNIDAVLWFAKEIFPEILKAYPEIRWYIIGSNPTEEIQNLANEHIIVTGYVSDEQLAGYYQDCRLSVVPLRYGAGVKGKVVESIYYQCPMITTPVGAEGISTDENVFEICEADEQMAGAIIELYKDEERLKKMAEGCSAYINKYFTRKQAAEVIRRDIFAAF